VLLRLAHSSAALRERGCAGGGCGTRMRLIASIFRWSTESCGTEEVAHQEKAHGQPHDVIDPLVCRPPMHRPSSAGWCPLVRRTLASSDAPETEKRRDPTRRLSRHRLCGECQPPILRKVEGQHTSIQALHVCGSSRHAGAKTGATSTSRKGLKGSRSDPKTLQDLERSLKLGLQSIF